MMYKPKETLPTSNEAIAELFRKEETTGQPESAFLAQARREYHFLKHATTDANNKLELVNVLSLERSTGRKGGGAVIELSVYMYFCSTCMKCNI